MSMIEIGGLASAVVAVFTLTGKIVNLITTIQSLINRLDQLQKDMATTKDLWAETTTKYVNLDQRIRDVEFQMAIQ